MSNEEIPEITETQEECPTCRQMCLISKYPTSQTIHVSTIEDGAAEDGALKSKNSK